MKLLCLVALLLSPCCLHAQAPGLPVGKWQLVEREANDGAKDYTVPVKDGRVLTFYPEYLVREGKGAVGNYSVHGDQLQLLLPATRTEYYRWFFSSNKPDRLYLSPSNEHYQCICDEGCLDVYQKL